MPVERLIPETVATPYGVVTLQVLIDGVLIDPTVGILSITVVREINRIPTATVVIRDGDGSIENFEQSESSRFVPGKRMEIKGGRDGHYQILFKGIIVCQAIKVRNNQNTLTVESKDETVRMTIGRKNKYFTDVTDSDVMSQILGNYNATGTVESTTGQHAELVQYHATDWDFMLMRAEANGKLVIVNDGRVSVKAPNFETPILSVGFGATLLEFDAEMDARTQWQEVEAQSWNYKNQELEVSSTSAINFREHGNLTGATLAQSIAPPQYEMRHSGQLSSAEMDAWTKAALLKSRMSKIRGRAKFEGTSVVNIGKWIEITGVGARFKGIAYISGVRHEFVNGVWFTHAQFGMSPEWYASKGTISDFPAAGLTPSVSGLQIGVVVQLQSDPKGEDRILVKLPTLDSNAQGIWSRMACLDAGNDRGSFFRPEIGDEVILGFINNDPREAIVLGQLNSSKNPSPLQAQDTNHLKGFFTRSKMKFQFDDEKSIITLDTPGGNSLVIDDDAQTITLQDQTGNKIEMSPSGIKITSPKDISIEATGKIAAKATADASLEGMNTTLKASANLTVNGSAGVSVGSSGVTKVEGSLVKIN